MTEVELKAEKIRKDAEEAAANKAPAWADSLIKRMDSMEEGVKADKARKDAEEAKLKADADKTEEELKADKARKDSEEAEAKKKEEEEAEKSKADSALKANADLHKTIADMQSRMNVLTQPLSSADRDALSSAQSRADSVCQMFGESAAAPLHGESPISYRKRLAAKLQKHSKDFADVKLDSIEGPTFDTVEARIYADAQAHASSPAVAVAGRLIPHVRQDSAGRFITTYTGDMDVWLGQFKSKPVYITGFNKEGSNKP